MGDLETVATWEKSAYAAKTARSVFSRRLISDVPEIIDDYLLTNISSWLIIIRARIHLLYNAELRRDDIIRFLSINCAKWVMSSSYFRSDYLDLVLIIYGWKPYSWTIETRGQHLESLHGFFAVLSWSNSNVGGHWGKHRPEMYWTLSSSSNKYF